MTQAATEAAEQAAGYKATGIGWTGLQAWLAENAQEPESDSTGEVVPSNDPLDGTKDLSSQLRNWPLNRNQDNGLVIVTQPVSGRIDNGSDDSIFALTTEVEGGVSPYTYEWRCETNWTSTQRDYLDNMLDSLGSVSFAEQYQAEASSDKSQTQTVTIRTDFGRTEVNELQEKQSDTEAVLDLIRLNSAPADVSSSDKNTSTYYASKPGNYFLRYH